MKRRAPILRLCLRQAIGAGLLAWIGVSSASVAHLTHVEVVGPTYPLPKSMGLEPMNVTLSAEKINVLAQRTSTLKPKKAGFMPLTTHLKQCDAAPARRVNTAHLQSPLFVIGTDARSLAWLARYRVPLEKAHAIGLIVQTDSEASLIALKKEAGRLTVYPGNGDALAHRFGLRCYPAVISDHLIEH